MKRICWWGWLLFGLYLAVVFQLTVFRPGFSFARFGTPGTVNWLPLADLWATLRDDGFWVFARLFFGNIGWFVPFGFGLRLLLPRLRTGSICLLGFLCSLWIETMQFCFAMGISEPDDLLLNTLGVWLGCLAADWWLRRAAEAKE